MGKKGQKVKNQEKKEEIMRHRVALFNDWQPENPEQQNSICMEMRFESLSFA